ncbi:S41 family peptidase [Vibrio penaeicida]|uniref:S41 family peptidase n=1 Tax=Vibrio penaeicida TaxID=104609 RepID=UPI001CC35C13|nr:S41 family peptidase [Vibrio penaeicida]
MSHTMRFSLLAALISGVLSPAHATQIPKPNEAALQKAVLESADETVPETGASNAPLWLRNTALSPDGKTLAFTYQSKIFLVSSQGGDARSITNGDFYPHNLMWSPDNQTLAFAANPYGNDDVFTINLKTGQMARHTYHSGSDIPTGFSENGDALLFSTSRLTNKTQDFYSLPEGSLYPLGNQLYRVALHSNQSSAVLSVPAKHAVWNSDETKLLYNSPHKDQQYRKHQRSFAVPNIWLYDATTCKHSQLTEDRIAAQQPIWNADESGFYYLSERDGNFNVWFYDLTTAEKSQLTHLSTHPVRHLSVDGEGNLAFSYNGELYTQLHDDKTSKKVNINIHNFTVQPSQYHFTNNATSFVPSELDVGEMLLSAYGDIYAFDAEKTTVKNITNTIGAEKHVEFTSDGYGAIYSALRDGKWGLYTAYSQKEEERLSKAIITDEAPFLVSEEHNLTHPKYSPDGNKLAFIVDGRALHVLDISDSNEESVLDKIEDALTSEDDETANLGVELISAETVSESNRMEFSWSPDSSQLAVHLSPSPYVEQIHVVQADGSESSINVSQSGFYNGMPQWSADGRILFWETSKYGTKSADGEDTGFTLNGIFVNNRAKKDFRDNIEPPEENESAPSYAFNANNIEYREAFHLPFSTTVIGAHLMGDHLLVIDMYSDPSGEYSTRGFSYNIRTNESSLLFSGLPEANSVYISSNQEFAYLLTEYDVIEVDTNSGEPLYHAIDLPVDFDVVPRRKAAFDQIVTQTKEQYYRPDMDNVDWDFYSDNYRKFLPHINNDLDFATILSELSGELNSSHTGGYGSPKAPMRYDETASLGLVFAENIAPSFTLTESSNTDAKYNADETADETAEKTTEEETLFNLVIKEVLPGGPADIEDVVLKTGDRITAINGKPVSNLAELSQALNNKVDTPVAVTLMRGEKNTWQQEITPMSDGEQYGLVSKRWELARRDHVLKTSNGKVGYVYLPDMSAHSFEHLRAEALGRLRNTESLIIDVRFNRGGFLADTLIEFLTAQKAAVVVPKKGKPASDASRRSWLKPSVVIANSASYSEGSAFSQYYQDLNVGPIIGEPVPGTGTAVMGAFSSVYPDVFFSFPYLPLKTSDGRYYENLELIPDIQAFNRPSEIAVGKDTQLDTAIEAALSQIQP